MRLRRSRSPRPRRAVRSATALDPGPTTGNPQDSEPGRPEEPEPTREGDGEQPREEGENTCCICLDVLEGETTMSLECTHSYHARCLATWFRSGDRKCPLCRADPPHSPSSEVESESEEEEEDLIHALTNMRSRELSTVVSARLREARRNDAGIILRRRARDFYRARQRQQERSQAAREHRAQPAFAALRRAQQSLDRAEGRSRYLVARRAAQLLVLA